MKSWRLWKRTGVIGGYSKVSFFKYEYWVGHLWKVSRDFFRYLKLSEIEAEKRNYFILKPQVNCRNISPVNQQWPKLSYFIKTQWFDGVWKVSNDSDSIWWLSGWRQLNIDKALESHISEILETLDKDYHDWSLLQTKFFQQRILSRLFVECFNRFLQIFKTFRNWSREKKLLYLKTTGQL